MYEEIIENIQKSLSGNSALDKDYLISQLDFYKNHEYASEITKEISRMFWDCLSEEEVDFLNESHEKNEILKTFDQAIELVEKNDNKSALKVLEKFFDTFIDKYSSSNEYQYHSFLNPLEVLIFYNYIGFDNDKLDDYNTDIKEKSSIENKNAPFERQSVHSLGNYDHFGIEDPIAYRRKMRKRAGFQGKQVVIRKKNDIDSSQSDENPDTKENNEKTRKPLKLIPYSEPLFDLYYIFGSLLASEGKFDDAEIALKKALKINPISSKALLELADIYKLRTVTFNRFFLLNMEALKYAYSLKDMARAYRNIAYYYLEEYNLELAGAFYSYSLRFDNNRNAIKELQYIKSRGIDIAIDDGKIEETIKSKNVQLGANPFILDSLETLSLYFESRGFYNQALYFYRILYELTHDNSVLGKINSIQNRI